MEVLIYLLMKYTSKLIFRTGKQLKTVAYNLFNFHLPQFCEQLSCRGCPLWLTDFLLDTKFRMRAWRVLHFSSFSLDTSHAQKIKLIQNNLKSQIKRVKHIWMSKVIFILIIWYLTLWQSYWGQTDNFIFLDLIFYSIFNNA